MLAPLLATRRAAASQGMTIPAPTGGWDRVSSISDMPDDRALVLDNWFPVPGDVRVRRGFALHGNGMGSGVVDSILVYEGVTAAQSKMFAATANTFYDVSSSGSGSSSLTGLASNRWRSVNFTTSGGKFLWGCNGLDDPKHFDGSSWATPSLTGVTPSDITHVNAFKGRIWVVLRESTKIGYLPLESVAGAVTTLELGSYFSKGGYLVAMATWTRDGGDGEDDLAVFISSEGQAAVFAGTDPASATTWAHIGTYNVGRPIGVNCFNKVGADLTLLNEDGVLPLSRGLEIDRGAAGSVAITARINNAMNEAARSYSGNYGWELTPYSKGTMAILNVPIAEGSTQHQYVMNTLTGAWCRFTGWNANCFKVFKGNLYFGSNDGKVNRADFGGTDGGTEIDAVGQGAYHFYRSRGQQKQWKMIQPFVTTDQQSQLSIGLSTDFKDNATLGTPSTVSSNAALYDTAIYDTDTYAVESRTLTDWSSLSGVGVCASVHFRAIVDAAGDVTLRLNGFNVIYEKGGLM